MYKPFHQNHKKPAASGSIFIGILALGAVLILSQPLPSRANQNTSAKAIFLKQQLGKEAEASEQVRRVVLSEVASKINAPGYTPQVPKVTIVGNYAMAHWELGEGGGYALAIKEQGVWRAILHGDDWGGIKVLEQDGVPRRAAERLLDRAMPEWRQLETTEASSTQALASNTALPMTIVFDEGAGDITVPDQDTSLSAYGGRLRRYDVHIAKMFEVTDFLCQQRLVGGSIDWSYQAGGGNIDMGKFTISCRLASDVATAYGLGHPELTTIRFSQGEGESTTRSYDIPIFDITSNKVPKWMNFVQGFKPRR